MGSRGYIACDLDGTLAVYDGWKGPDHIGEPVPKMVTRVKWWLEHGFEVRIFTARAEDLKACAAIQEWCKIHIGQVLPITNKKDYDMLELWDDKAVQIVKNTGERVDGKISIVPEEK